MEQGLARLRDGVDRGVAQLPAAPGAAHARYAYLEGLAHAREHLGVRRGGLLRCETLEAGNPSLDLMLGPELAGLVVHRLGHPVRAVGPRGEHSPYEAAESRWLLEQRRVCRKDWCEQVHLSIMGIWRGNDEC